MGRDIAIREAIKACISAGEIKDFLNEELKEVLSVLTFEYDYELDMQAQRREAKIEGREEGKLNGKMEMALGFMCAGESVERVSKISNIPVDVLLRAREDFKVVGD